jgi:hypothetical protein
MGLLLVLLYPHRITVLDAQRSFNSDLSRHPISRLQGRLLETPVRLSITLCPQMPLSTQLDIFFSSYHLTVGMGTD